MKAVIHFTAELPESVAMAERAVQSFVDAPGWEACLRQGFTPATAPALPVMPGGYLDSHEGIKRRTKIACVANHVRFWMETAADDDPAAFIEHDAQAIARPPLMTHDLLHLSYDTARHGRTPKGHRIAETYCIDNQWKGARIFPGTSAYAVTPAGARKLLDAFFTYGAEQSDWIINSAVVDADAVSPSPVRWAANTFNSSSGRYWQ